MTVLTPQLAVIAVLTTGVGAIMSRLGVLGGALRLRHAARRCVSCGRLMNGRNCERCGTAR